MKEIRRLETNGWRIRKRVSVSDSKLREDAKVTTGGQFLLFKAPQIVDNAPAVLPYLQAFQDQHHVSIVFLIDDLKPYNGIEQVETAALVVRHMPADHAYQYDALIQQHTGKLPELTQAPQPIAGGQSAPAPKAPAGPQVQLLPLMLILLGVGLGGGILLFGWVAKRAERSVPTRNSPR